MIFHIVTSDPRLGGRILFRGELEVPDLTRQAVLTTKTKEICGWSGRKTFNRMLGDVLAISLRDDPSVQTLVSSEFIPDEELQPS